MEEDKKIDLIIDQQLLCKKYKVPFTTLDETLKLGISLDPESNKYPIHGLRHFPNGSTSGWYIWTGEYSEEQDFFQGIHITHLFNRRPEVMKYLVLPPGYRFLIAEGYEDVWFDENLLIDENNI